MIGYLHIGEVRAEIEAIVFNADCMSVQCTLGPDVAAELKGHVYIEGLDGTVCWRGTKWHDYGVKTADGAFGPSIWTIVLNADLFDRTSATVTARFDVEVSVEEPEVR
jgi:hypothetical protein